MDALEILHLIANVCALLSVIALIAVVHRFPDATTLHLQILEGEFTEHAPAQSDGTGRGRETIGGENK